MRKLHARFIARLLACLVVCLLVALPLFGQALPPNPARPQRTLPDARWKSGKESRPVPIAPKQGHEGPEVFSARVGMHPLLKRFLDQYTSPVWKEWLRVVLRRAEPFRGYIESRIQHYNMPPELLYLPIAESSYDPYAVSRVGAAGLWQFMVMTGHLHNLEINSWVDQRFDFWKATDAALETLKENHAALGSWLLALAAYNAGLGFMEQLVATTGIHDFWTLAERGYLPHETVDYVPRFLALAAICSYPGRYGLPLSWQKPMKWARIKLDQSVDLRLLAVEANVSQKLLMEGNAAFRYRVTPSGHSSTYLNVPEKDVGAVSGVLNSPKDSLMRFYVYPVQRGDTLYRLARHYGVPVPMILKYNNTVKPRHLETGTWLLIPAVRRVGPYVTPRPPLPTATKALRAKLASKFTASYTVQRGNTLWSIARRFETLPEDIALVNNLDNLSVILPGQVLRVPPVAKTTNAADRIRSSRGEAFKRKS